MAEAKEPEENKKPEETKEKDGELEAQFIDPATTAVATSVGWFAFKAMVQAILGWIAINYYQKIRRWISKKWKARKGKDDDDSDQGDFEPVSAKKSAAAS
jgi:hypothetical protein